jgi:uncharacterized protein YndB with AHSA1/START domain
MVFDAWTRPELLKRWLGVFGGWTFAVCEVDLRVGGKYRFVWRGKDGNEMGMGGLYREIVRPERIVCTEKFDDPWYEGDAIDTTTFVERAGKTTMTTTVLYASKEIRDAVLRSPMESGVAKSYDKLAEVLAATPVRSGK